MSCRYKIKAGCQVNEDVHGYSTYYFRLGFPSNDVTTFNLKRNNLFIKAINNSVIVTW